MPTDLEGAPGEQRRWFQSPLLRIVTFVLCLPLWALLVVADRKAGAGSRVAAALLGFLCLGLLGFVAGLGAGLRASGDRSATYSTATPAVPSQPAVPGETTVPRAEQLEAADSEGINQMWGGIIESCINNAIGRSKKWQIGLPDAGA